MSNTLRTSRIVDTSGSVTIGCASLLQRESVQLSVDGVEARCLRLRVYDARNTVICERLLRALPSTLSFRARSAGRYAIDVTPVGNRYARPSRTWSDWDADVGNGPSSAPPSVTREASLGHALIEVA